MGPNKEINSVTVEQQQHVETNEEFVARMDRRLQEAYVEYLRTYAAVIIDGNLDTLRNARSTFDNRITTEKDEYDRLMECGAENPDLVRRARLLGKRFRHKSPQTPTTPAAEEGKENNLLFLWKEACARLQFEGMQGAETLRNALQGEPDSQRRSSIYQALHEQDEILAQYVFDRLEQRRNKFQASGMSYAATLVSLRDNSFTPEDVRVMIEEAFRRFGPLIIMEDYAVAKKAGTDTMQPWDYPYWSHQARFHEGELSLDWKELTKNIIEALGHQDLFDRLTIRHPSKRYEIARCIMVNPPEEIVVIIHTPIEKNTEITEALHEIGHGIHYACVCPDLPFIDRVSTTPWHEAMATIYEQMMVESLAHDGKQDERTLQSLRKKYAVRNTNGLAAVLLRLYVDMELQSDYPDSNEVVAEKLVDLYKRFNPLVIDPAKYWWASDMYIVEYPFYGINYLYGFMIAAQIRAWWKRTHEEPLLSKAFGDFLREKCYAPGNSVPWRQLLKDITGEDVNPQYLVDELSSALDGSTQ